MDRLNNLTMRDVPQSENPNYGGELSAGNTNDLVGYDSPRAEAEMPAPKSSTMRELNIREVNRGFIVQAGCHTFAISTAKELTRLVTEYINDPSETERKWFEGKLMER
jgi:hypothetical protein